MLKVFFHETKLIIYRVKWKNDNVNTEPKEELYIIAKSSLGDYRKP